MTLYNHKSDRFRKKNLSCLTAHRLTPHYRCQDRLIEMLSHVLDSIRTWACFGVLTKICVNNIISATIFFSQKRKSHGKLQTKPPKSPQSNFIVYMLYTCICYIFNPRCPLITKFLYPDTFHTLLCIITLCIQSFQLTKTAVTLFLLISIKLEYSCLELNIFCN